MASCDWASRSACRCTILPVTFSISAAPVLMLSSMAPLSSRAASLPSVRPSAAHASRIAERKWDSSRSASSSL